MNGLTTRNSRTAMIAIHISDVESKETARRGTAVLESAGAATVTSISERVAPLLDHLRDALVDIRHGRPDGLDLADRLGARRRRALPPQRDGEVPGVDLRRLD